MGNGHGPPVYILSDSDYNTFSDGVHISRGTYAGCIKLGEVYYWVSAPTEGNYWVLNTGTPDSSQVTISSSVWDLCKNGGTYSWMGDDEWWDSGSETYRWGDQSGNVVLVEL